MNSGVKIIKRAGADRSKSSQPDQEDEKTRRQDEREIVSTIKSWITELAQQRRADEHSARARFFAAAHS